MHFAGGLSLLLSAALQSISAESVANVRGVGKDLYPTDLQTYRPTDLQTYRPTDLQTCKPEISDPAASL